MTRINAGRVATRLQKIVSSSSATVSETAAAKASRPPPFARPGQTGDQAFPPTDTLNKVPQASEPDAFVRIRRVFSKDRSKDDGGQETGEFRAIDQSRQPEKKINGIIAGHDGNQRGATPPDSRTDSKQKNKKMTVEQPMTTAKAHKQLNHLRARMEPLETVSKTKFQNPKDGYIPFHMPLTLGTDVCEIARIEAQLKREQERYLSKQTSKKEVLQGQVNDDVKEDKETDERIPKLVRRVLTPKEMEHPRLAWLLKGKHHGTRESVTETKMASDLATQGLDVLPAQPAKANVFPVTPPDYTPSQSTESFKSQNPRAPFLQGGHIPPIVFSLACQHLAGRWAAKEAVMKAHSHLDLGFQDIEILVDETKDGIQGKGSGKPRAWVTVQKARWKEAEEEKAGEEGEEGEEGEKEGEEEGKGKEGKVERREALVSISHDAGIAFAVCMGMAEE